MGIRPRLISVLAIVSLMGASSFVLAQTDIARKIVPIIAMLLLDEEALNLNVTVVDNGDSQTLKGIDYFATLYFEKQDTGNYGYSIIGDSQNVEVSYNGIVRYSPPVNQATGEIIVKIRIIDLDTDLSQDIEIPIWVLDTDVIAEGVIGASGGVLSDAWQDVVLNIPEGTVDTDANITVIGGHKQDGSYIYDIISSEEFGNLVDFRTPRVAESPEPAPSATARKGVSGQEISSSSRSINYEDSLTHWQDWEGTFLEVKRWFVNNGENRVPAGTDLNISSHKNILTHKYSDASSLFSLCGSETEYDANCEGRDPVLFVHGFTANGEDDAITIGPLILNFDFNLGGGQGGGKGTWGNFPSLIHDLDYAVFEFRWRTNATFSDSADDLASAIELIAKASGKKVNLVAHSFGGLLSRAYLQNYARTHPYRGDVQSLVTLGTPHSGIFDAPTTIDGKTYPKGQDNIIFETCSQSSCFQAGEPTPTAFEVPSELPLACIVGPTFPPNQWCVDAIRSGNYASTSIAEELGLGAYPGGFIHKIQSDEEGHQMPVNTKVLIGLTRDLGYDSTRPIDESNIDCVSRGYWESIPTRDKYETGDALISFEGQRFSYSSNQPTVDSSASVYQNGSLSVKEDILGIEQDNGASNTAVPGGYVAVTEAFDDDNGVCERIDFQGYRHTGPFYGVASTRGSAGEGNVKSIDNIGDTGAPHASYDAVKAWLQENRPADNYSTDPLFLRVNIVDIDTEEPINGAKVTFYANGPKSGSGTTDTTGVVVVENAFVKNASHYVSVSAAGYHTEEIYSGFNSGELPVSALIDTIKLQKEIVATGGLGGTITDSVTGNPIPNANYTLDRHGLVISGVSNTDGTYYLPELVAGIYTIEISKQGYESYKNLFVYVKKFLSNPLHVPLTPSATSLNDTGITWGGNYPSGNNTTCTGETIAQQDCSHGRDATYNDDSDGHAGFSFTKVSADGTELPAAMQSWSCVKDNITGLTWEVKKNMDGVADATNIHDADNTYRWGGITHEGTNYGTYYSDWDSLVNGSNAGSGLCGNTDWRVPSINELESLANFNQPSPAIDTAYFPNTPASFFWSASPSALNSSLAWVVNSYGGGSGNLERNPVNYGHVRLVRSGQ